MFHFRCIMSFVGNMFLLVFLRMRKTSLRKLETFFKIYWTYFQIWNCDDVNATPEIAFEIAKVSKTSG